MDRLYELVDAEGIHLYYDSLLTARRATLGLYWQDREFDAPLIALDHTLEGRYRLHRTVLAEELGHHMTVPQHSITEPATTYRLHVMRRRDEARARRWAADKLIPADKLTWALHQGHRTVHALARFFSVTESLVRTKMRHRRKKACL